MKSFNETSYVTPKVEIIQVEVEQGFATTGTGDDLGNEGDPLFF